MNPTNAQPPRRITIRKVTLAHKIKVWCVIISAPCLVVLSLLLYHRSQLLYLPEPLAFFNNGGTIYPVTDYGGSLMGTMVNDGESVTHVGITDNKKVLIFLIYSPTTLPSNQRYIITGQTSEGFIPDQFTQESAEKAALDHAKAKTIKWYDAASVRPMHW